MGRTNSCVKGGGGATTDDRAVYHGERPADWLRLPDYDKVESNSAYFLVLIKKNQWTEIGFSFRFGGTKTLSFGHCENGQFTADYPDYTLSTLSDNTDRLASVVLNYDDFSLYRDSEKAQVVVRLTGSANFNRLNFYTANATTQYKYNRGVVDMINNISVVESGYYAFNTARSPLEMMYAYNLVDINKCIPSQRYTDCVSTYVNETPFYAAVNINASLTTKAYGKPFKMASYYETFRNAYYIESVVMDISAVTTWNNPFRASCFSLGSLLFEGYENVSEFYDINLGVTNLSADALEAFFETLPTITTAKTLTCSSCSGYSSLTAEQIAIATSKNWTLA